jgi:hypothetical protein
MASSESKKKKEEIRQVFNEVYQLAYIGSSDIRKRSLEEYKVRFYELTERKKDGKVSLTLDLSDKAAEKLIKLADENIEKKTKEDVK